MHCLCVNTLQPSRKFSGTHGDSRVKENKHVTGFPGVLSDTDTSEAELDLNLSSAMLLRKYKWRYCVFYFLFLLRGKILFCGRCFFKGTCVSFLRISGSRHESLEQERILLWGKHTVRRYTLNHKKWTSQVNNDLDRRGKPSAATEWQHRAWKEVTCSMLMAQH